MANKPIIRICCGCRTRQPVAGMTRVVRLGDQFVVQAGKRLNGRGAHVCPACLTRADLGKCLSRSFKTAVPQSLVKQLATCVPNAKMEA